MHLVDTTETLFGHQVEQLDDYGVTQIQSGPVSIYIPRDTASDSGEQAIQSDNVVRLGLSYKVFKALEKLLVRFYVDTEGLSKMAEVTDIDFHDLSDWLHRASSKRIEEIMWSDVDQFEQLLFWALEYEGLDGDVSVCASGFTDARGHWQPARNGMRHNYQHCDESTLQNALHHLTSLIGVISETPLGYFGDATVRRFQLSYMPAIPPETRGL